jgi:hypothetical protein
MRKALTAALMLIAAVTATAADAPMEEVVVTGEYAGPGMWQVMHPDHPGHRSSFASLRTALNLSARTHSW